MKRKKIDELDLLEESAIPDTTYAIACGSCDKRVDDFHEYPSLVASDAYAKGYRVRENEYGEEDVMCPDCLKNEQI
jgi:hypothetical protein